MRDSRFNDFGPEFDRELDRDIKRTQRVALAFLIFWAVIFLAVLGAIGFATYKILANFGIL